MKLSKEEIIVGSLHSLIVTPFIGLLALVVVPVSAFLFAYGGASFTSKAWRRIGVPLVCGIAIGVVTGAWLAALVGSLCAWGALSVGYGIPDISDTGSTLGRFIYKITDSQIGDVHDQRYTTIIVRSILYLAFGACYYITMGVMG